MHSDRTKTTISNKHGLQTRHCTLSPPTFANRVVATSWVKFTSAAKTHRLSFLLHNETDALRERCNARASQAAALGGYKVKESRPRPTHAAGVRGRIR